MKNANKLTLITVTGIILLAGAAIYIAQQNENTIEKWAINQVLQEKEESVDEDQLILRFTELNGAGTNFCAGPSILEQSSVERLQGACCGKMDFHRYKEQLEGLEKYANIEQIPTDPYDISRELADELLEYQKTIVLSVAQQKIYDDAVTMSHEGGPCCCKCWRWYAFEGLAKYLITEHGFTAEQIAEVWDLEDGCGGTGHAHG